MSCCLNVDRRHLHMENTRKMVSIFLAEPSARCPKRRGVSQILRVQAKAVLPWAQHAVSRRCSLFAPGPAPKQQLRTGHAFPNLGEDPKDGSVWFLQELDIDIQKVVHPPQGSIIYTIGACFGSSQGPAFPGLERHQHRRLQDTR